MQIDVEVLKFFLGLLTPEEFGKTVADESERINKGMADHILQMLEDGKYPGYEKYRSAVLRFRDLKPEERAQALVSHPRIRYAVLKESVRTAKTPERLKQSLEELTSGSTPLRFSGFLALELGRADQERAWMLRSACVKARLPKTWYYYLAPVLYQDFRDRIPADYVHLSPQKKSALLGMIRLMSKEVGGSVLALLIEKGPCPGWSEVVSALTPNLTETDASALVPKLDSSNPAVRTRALEFIPGLFRDHEFSEKSVAELRNATIPEKIKKIRDSDPDVTVRKKAQQALEKLDKVPLYRVDRGQ